jgi:hypothetical protein
MTPVEQGRHCGVCSKNVIDFTKFSDKELLDFLSTPQQNICGRFNNKQLNREISKPLEPKQYSLPTTWLFGLSLLAGTIAAALPITTYATPTLIEQSLERKINKTPNGDSTRVIKGFVKDSTTSENLVGVTVLIKNTKIGVATDFNGKFILKVPKEYLDKDIVLEVRYLGYKTQFVAATNYNYLSVALSETELEIAGEVILGAVYKPTRWQRIKGFFRRLF